ncbi:MAG: hypothetical protein HY397_02105 [Candidatus Doudnabacteria bacterium]|nr:hypothetical protein [Candidatus Doudnabacteria bacterium]
MKPSAARKKNVPAGRREYCAVDLEGTGLDPKKDAIIEVGAVRFAASEKGELVFEEEFSELVKPKIPIPEFIQGLTGITDKTVAAAPPWEKVSTKFREFVGDRIIVGQNIPFDLAFLAGVGMKFEQPFIDTKELAQVFLPWVKHFNLEYLMRHFNQSLVSHHRALDDAKSAVVLLQKIMETARGFPVELRPKLINLLSESNLHYKDLFLLALKQPPLPNGAVGMTSTGQAEQMSLFRTPQPSPRAGQGPGLPRKTRAVLEQIIGAPGINFVHTSIGAKFEGYLTVFPEFIKPGSQGAVVSLPDDFEFADLPLLFRSSGWLVIEDPAHFICPDRLEKCLRRKSRPAPFDQFLVKLLIWRSREASGRITRMPLYGQEYFFIGLVTREFQYCSAHRQRPDCKLQHTLQALSARARIVTSHSAWLKLFRYAKKLSFARMFFYDVQALERACLNADATTLSLSSLRELLTLVHSPNEGRGMMEKIDADAPQLVATVLNELDLTFGLWNIAFNKNFPVNPQWVVDDEFRDSEIYPQFLKPGERLVSTLDKLIDTLSTSKPSESPQRVILDKLIAVKHFLEEFFFRPKPNRIYWLDAFYSGMKLKAQSKVFEHFANKRKVQITFFGLLPNQGAVEYYERIFSLPQANFSRSPAPALPLKLYLPEFQQSSKQVFRDQQANKALQHLLERFTGRTIVLSSSQRSLEQLYETLAETDFKSRLLVQRLTGHQWKNLENFTADPKAIWLLTANNFMRSTSSLPGVAQIVFWRIPYEVPGVLASAYDEQSVFEKYILPKTAINLLRILQILLGSADISPVSSQPLKVFFLDRRVGEGYNEVLLQTIAEEFQTQTQEFDLFDPDFSED